MKFSTNFNLNLPDLDDKADIRKINENFQKIDELIKENESDPELETKIDEINDKIGNPTDDETKQTLFGKNAKLEKMIGDVEEVLSQL